MSPTRRQFLKTTLGSATLLSAGVTVPTFLARTAAAAQGKSGDRVLVVVQLAGGNDGLNTVIPFADDHYLRNRPTLRIGAGQALKIDDYLGLHPRMAGFSRLLEEKRLAIVQGVGYPNPDRSHFRSMDIWQSARPELPTPVDGWLGRALDASPRPAGHDVPALHIGGNRLPVALISEKTAVPSVESLANFRVRTETGALPVQTLRTLAQPAVATEPPLVEFLRRSTLAAYDSSGQVQAALAEERSTVSYPNFELATKLKHVSQLIDAGLSTRIYYVSLDGFDTHAEQAAAHGNLLAEVSESITAFVDDLAGRGQLDRVLLMTFSEFGRRLKENASLGTDHGAGAPLFVAGSKVNSGLIGKHPSLTDLDDGDLKHHTDFRQVYATLLDGWLGCSSEKVLGQKYEPVAALA